MEFDENLFLVLNEYLNGPFLTHFFKTVTWFGNGTVQAVLVVPFMFLFSRMKFKKHIIAITLTGATGGLFVVGAKEVVGRPRPGIHFEQYGTDVAEPAGRPSDNSFPSGHTQTAFSTAVYLCFLYPHLSAFFLLLAVLTGLSRIALGVHFPLDVLTGALLGAVFAFAGYRMNSSMLRRPKG